MGLKNSTVELPIFSICLHLHHQSKASQQANKPTSQQPRVRDRMHPCTIGTGTVLHDAKAEGGVDDRVLF